MHRCRQWRYLLWLVLLPACGTDVSGPPGELTGTYDLTTIDGVALPAEWSDGDCSAEYRRMDITFVSEQSLRIRLRARVVCNDGDWDVEIDTYADGAGESHAYTFRSDTLRIYRDERLMLRGPATDSRLQLTAEGGAVLVFLKQPATGA